MPNIRARLFGGLELNDAIGEPLTVTGRKTRALLGFLVVEADRWHHRDRLTGLLWADRAETQARNSLNQALYEIRKLETAAGVTLIERETDRVRLVGVEIETDLSEFQADLKADTTQAANQRVSDLLRGLESVSSEFDDWLAAKRDQFQAAQQVALKDLIAEAIDGGHAKAGIAAARGLIELDPLDEAARRSLMALLAQSGNRAAAIREYQACAKVLQEELGIEPDLATKKVLEDVQYSASTETASEPVDVQDWRTDQAAHSPSDVNEPPALPDKPSIAVLPFTNMSDDPEQEYFADGMTEDIITELSRFEDLFVISRTTSFVYKDERIDAKAVAHELGVHFILEGSVRKAGQRVRITAQLVNGQDGGHVWAERYDGALEDIFDLQEQVTSQVVGSVWPQISEAELDRTERGERSFGPGNELAWKARAAMWSGRLNRDPGMSERATAMALDAVKMDPTCSIAYQTICFGYAMDNLFRWGDNPSAAADLAEEWAKKFLIQFPNSYMAYFSLGLAHIAKKKFHDANRDFQHAHQLNPNDSFILRFWAWSEAGAGEFESAKKHALMAIRLSPRDPRIHVAYLALAMAAFIERDDAAFEDWVGGAIRMQPSSPIRRAMMIAYAANAGDQELLETHHKELMEFAPDFIDSLFRGENQPFQQPEHMAILLDGLRKAGFPK